jgi:hypothetical protein
METLERRNKNFNKTKIDYDVNVFVREEYNPETMESFWNEDRWYLHVYNYNDGSPIEVSTPFLLTKEESFAMNFMETEDIDDGLDGWMSMDYLMENYRDQMSDRILEYLESFPKYHEDIRLNTVFN